MSTRLMEMMLAEEADRSEWEMMMEMILAEDTTAARPAVSTTVPPRSDEPDTEPMMGGYGGGMGGYGGGGYGYGYGGGYGGGGYGGYGGIPPEERKDPNSPDANSPENRP